MAHVERHYESMESLVEDCKGRMEWSQTNQELEWYGGTFKQAIDRAINGWPEGVEKIEKYVRLFESALGSKLVIDEYFYDVTGQDFDLDRVLIGEPEAWLNSEPVVVNAPALHVLSLVVNIGARGTISPEVIIRKGAAVLALVSLLEKSRRRVEITCVSYADWPASKGNSVMLTLNAKHANADLDLSKLAFALISPAMLRRLVFSIREHYMGYRVCKYTCGHSQDQDKVVGDINVPFSDNYETTWATEASAQEWIMEQLKSQGVELKES